MLIAISILGVLIIVFPALSNGILFKLVNLDIYLSDF
jgi:hypothetical protein